MCRLDGLRLDKGLLGREAGWAPLCSVLLPATATIKLRRSARLGPPRRARPDCTALHPAPACSPYPEPHASCNKLFICEYTLKVCGVKTGRQGGQRKPSLLLRSPGPLLAGGRCQRVAVSEGTSVHPPTLDTPTHLLPLQYFRKKKTLLRHLAKCPLRHPPGDEIYRSPPPPPNDPSYVGGAVTNPPIRCKHPRVAPCLLCGEVAPRAGHAPAAEPAAVHTASAACLTHPPTHPPVHSLPHAPTHSHPLPPALRPC